MDKLKVRRELPPPSIKTFVPPPKIDAARDLRRKLYDSAAWKRLRARKLSQDPLCPKCVSQGRPGPATEVHHIKPLATHPELALVLENLEGLCHTHHNQETAREKRYARP